MRVLLCCSLLGLPLPPPSLAGRAPRARRRLSRARAPGTRARALAVAPRALPPVLSSAGHQGSERQHRRDRARHGAHVAVQGVHDAHAARRADQEVRQERRRHAPVRRVPLPRAPGEFLYLAHQVSRSLLFLFARPSSTSRTRSRGAASRRARFGFCSRAPDPVGVGVVGGAVASAHHAVARTRGHTSQRIATACSTSRQCAEV